jgi:hypothetical protein
MLPIEISGACQRRLKMSHIWRRVSPAGAERRNAPTESLNMVARITLSASRMITSVPGSGCCVATSLTTPRISCAAAEAGIQRDAVTIQPMKPVAEREGYRITLAG